MNRETGRIEERLSQTRRDLEEIDDQVAAGELDKATADRLRQRYESEQQELRAQMTEAATAATEADVAEGAGTDALSGSRLLLIGAVLVALVGGGLWWVAANSGGQSGVEGIASEVVDGVNLDDVTNEQMEAVVAENPNVPGMRLALADRYFAEGDFSNALTHYLYVLETLEVKDPAALANVGWMTYLSGVPDVAASFVEESLAVQPDGGIAFWYLANIRFFGLGDATGAVSPLQSLLDYENLPDELRAEAESLLIDVEAAQ